MTARSAVTLTFLVHGLIGASWVARIPQIKDHLGLSDGALGLVLLGAPAGTVFAVRFAGVLIGRLGGRTVTRASGLLACAALVPLGAAGHPAALAGALVLLGASLGVMDVGMNALGVAVERARGRPLMSGFHGAYSVGTLAGALAGASAAHLAVPVPWHLTGTAIVLAAGVPAAGHRLPDRSADLRDEAPAGGAGRRWVLAVLGIIGLCSFVGEGAMADWSAVHLRDVLGAGPGTAGLGYAGCAVAMAAGRLAGDRLVARFGPVAVLRCGALVACLGLGTGLAAGRPEAAVAGCTLFGLGVAPVAPVTFGAAGNLPGVPAATAIARVTSVGYLGLLGGPPVIGFVAQGVGLAWALAVPAALAGLIAVLAGAARPR